MLRPTAMRRGGNRRLGIVAVCSAAIALVAAAPAATANRATQQTYEYVALGGTYVIGPDLAAAALRHHTGVSIAPLGSVAFVAGADRFTMSVNEHGVRRGTVPVTVVTTSPDHSPRSVRHLCVLVWHETVVSDVVPGDRVSLSIWDAATRQGCDRGGTAGRLTITS